MYVGVISKIRGTYLDALSTPESWIPLHGFLSGSDRKVKAAWLWSFGFIGVALLRRGWATEILKRLRWQKAVAEQYASIYQL